MDVRLIKNEPYNGVGEDLGGKLSKSTIVNLLNEFYRQPSAKSLAMQQGRCLLLDSSFSSIDLLDFNVAPIHWSDFDVTSVDWLDFDVAPIHWSDFDVVSVDWSTSYHCIAGMDHKIFLDAFTQFRKKCATDTELSPDLHVVISDIINGHGTAIDLFPYFLRFARQVGIDIHLHMAPHPPLLDVGIIYIILHLIYFCIVIIVC